MKSEKMSNITLKWVDTIIPFSNNYSAQMTASELSKITGIPQQSVSRTLNQLVRFSFFSYIQKGKNKFFFIDLRRMISKIILGIIENYKALKFYHQNKKISVIINDLLKNCDGLIIFGSYASKDYNPNSDLDLVAFGVNKDEFKKIKNRYSVEIHEHCVSYRDFENLLKKRNPLTVEVLNNHILFGDVSKIINIFWKRGI